MVRSGKVAETVKNASEFGIELKEANFNWKRARNRKEEIVNFLRQKRNEAVARWKIELFREQAFFLSPEEVGIGKEKIRAEKIIIAAGSKVAKPPVPGIEHCITSDEAFDLPQLPKEIAILGGGAVAIEFSYIFSQAGVKVTLIEMQERLAGTEDKEISQALEKSMKNKGIEVLTSSAVKKIEKTTEDYRITFEQNGKLRAQDFSLVMNALGRIPNLEGLELEKAGVEVEKRAVKVNEFLQTTNPNIYAAGDAIGGFMLTSVAYYEGRLAAKNAIERNAEAVDYSIIPRAIFFQPEIGSVGLTEDEAKKTSLPYVIGKAELKAEGVFYAESLEDGLVKIIVEKPGGRILGAHIFAENAGELIQIISVAMASGATIEELANHIYTHPTLAEVIGNAALEAIEKLKH